MPLAPGTRLGAYEVVALLAAGGMGEVYRARDARLQRDVALKILPALVAADPERHARLTREALVLASLNHPSIAAIYGLEETPEGTALVMELVTGETLASRIARRPLPITEVVAIAREICDALEAAHGKGVIHRDLKPANIAFTEGGRVKVLDFGLATFSASPPDASRIASLDDATLTAVGVTRAGVILGTAAYMSPEQATATAVDKRTDIWAFGCVLYEMITGRPLFSGAGVSETIIAVLTKEPDWTQLPAATPAPLTRLLRHCVARDPRRRLADIADARLELEEALGASSAEPAVARTRIVTSGAVAIAVAAAALGLMAGGLAMRGRSIGSPLVTRLSITPATPATLTLPSGAASDGRDVAVSPNGRQIAFIANAGSQLLLRPLDRLETTVVEGAETPRHPFFSADGAWLGFFDGRSIKKVPARGGAAIKVVDIVGDGRGATWAADNTIVFATNDPATGLWSVSADGGQPAAVTTLDDRREGDHVWPEVLPDGKSVLFTIWGGRTEDSRIAIVELSTRRVMNVLDGGAAAHYVSSGHIVYTADGILRATRFNLTRRSVVGSAVPVIQPLMVSRYGAADYDVSTEGTLVYVRQDPRVAARTLVWVARDGSEEAIDAPVHAYQYPRLSPDGSKLALDVRDRDADIWIWEFARHVATRLTSAPTLEEHPTWTPDGQRLIFSSGPPARMNLYWQRADGTGAQERLTDSPNDQRPYTVSPDGQWLSLRQDAASQDLMKLDLRNPHRLEPLVQTRFNETNGDISPDGRWLAYQANDTGRDEIWVRPLPMVDEGRWQLSVDGGIQPKWSPTGRELFFLAPDGTLMAVAVDPGPRWHAGGPAKLFKGPYFFTNGGAVNTLGWTYEISRDGKRFLMIKSPPAALATPSIVVVQNWFVELDAGVRARR